MAVQNTTAIMVAEGRRGEKKKANEVEKNREANIQKEENYPPKKDQG